MGAVQESLFEQSRRAPKAVADTSVEAFADVRANLGERQLKVLKALVAYRRLRKEWPTSYELLEWLRILWPQYDLNSIRPRLTELRGDELRFVSAGDKRKCRITNKRVYVWSVTPRGEAYLRGQK